MTVEELCKVCELNPIYMADPTAQVCGAYACDLLSWVIGRAPEKAALVTVMTNVNVIAVAVMADLSCVILCEGVSPDDAALQKAKEQGVTVLSSEQPVYETCKRLGAVL